MTKASNKTFFLNENLIERLPSSASALLTGGKKINSLSIGICLGYREAAKQIHVLGPTGTLIDLLCPFLPRARPSKWEVMMGGKCHSKCVKSCMERKGVLLVCVYVCVFLVCVVFVRVVCVCVLILKEERAWGG